jgi:glycosyltransferase involved in cell wall biosynthesis
MVAPIARRLGIPLVVSFLGYDVGRLSRLPNWQRVYQRLSQDTAATIGISRYICAKLGEIGFVPGQITRISLGTDLTALHYRDPAHNFTGPIVHCLHVGRLVPKKAPLQLVKASALARARLSPALDLRLTIAGDGPLHDAVRQEVHALHLQDAVLLLGRVDHAAVLRLMQDAHIYTQHCVTGPDGDTEGQGVSFVEASASGLPIVTTRHNGIPDVVLDGKTGYLVEEGDIEGMAARIVELARHPARWTEFGRAGRQHIEAHFTLDQQIDKTLALYHSILERTR